MEERKAFVLRLPPDTWLQFKKFLLDNGLSAQQWFEARVQEALESYLQGKKKGK